MQKLNIPDEFFAAYPRSLLQRDYQRVFEMINAVWGTLECQEYLDGIVLMELSNTNRQGFPMEIFTELAELHNIHTDITATFCKDFTGWTNPDTNIR